MCEEMPRYEGPSSEEVCVRSRGGLCVWKERLGEEWLCVGVYRREGYVCI